MSGFGGSYPKAPPHAHPLQQGGQYFQNSRASERPFQPTHSILSHPSQELPTRSSRTYSNSQRPRESNGATNYQKPRVTSKPSISKPSATITDYHQLHPFLQQASYGRRPFQPTSTSLRLERPSRKAPKLNTSTISHEVRRSPDTLYRPESRSPPPAYYAHPPQASKQSSGGRASKTYASEPTSPFDSTKASQTSKRTSTSMASAHQKPQEPDVNGVSLVSSRAPTPVAADADWALSSPKVSPKLTRHSAPLLNTPYQPTSHQQQPQPQPTFGGSGWHDDPTFLPESQPENRKSSRNSSTKSKLKRSFFSRLWKK